MSPTQVPLGSVLAQYYENHAKQKKSKTQAKVAAAKWKEFFGAATVSDLTVARMTLQAAAALFNSATTDHFRMPYTIRRTMATELRRRGVDMGEIAGLLGHTPSGLEITDLYAEYSPDFMSHTVRARSAAGSDMRQRRCTACAGG